MKSGKTAYKPFAIGIVLFLIGILLSGCGEPELGKIEISPAEKTLTVGESATFEASALSTKDKEMPDAAIEWSVDGKAGSIDEKGRFTATMPGSVSVTAKSGNITGQAGITVVPVAVASLDVQAEKENALAGSKVQVRVKALSKDGSPAGFNPLAVSSPTEGIGIPAEAITVGSDGFSEVEATLAPTPGPNKIIFKSGDTVKEIQLQGTAVTRLAISPDEKWFEAGGSVQFTAQGYDQFGNHRSVQPQWSMVKKNAVLKADGEVLMEKPGDGILMARYDDLTLGKPFTIIPGKLSKIELTPGTIQLKAGQTALIEPKGFNQYGYPLPVDVAWSLKDDLGTMAADGTFMAKKAGESIITASKAGVSSEVSVTVEPGPLADISIRIKEKQVEAGQTITLEAKGLDAFGNTFKVDPEWLLSKSLGTIDKKKATFTALHTGTGEIRAKVDNILAVYPVEVTPSVLARLHITPENVDIIAGEIVQFGVTGFDRFGNQVAVRPELSMEMELGEFTPEGLFKAQRAGNTTVTAQAEKITAQSTLAVAPAEMETVSIEPQGPVALRAGKSQRFSVTGRDAYGNIVKAAIDWKLSADLGSIDSQGVFMPTTVGEGQLAAAVKQIRTDIMLNIQVPVEVIPGEPARIKAAPAKLEMIAGEEKQIEATTYDAYGNQTVTPLTWRVGKTPIGEIDQRGMLTAERAGTGIVRITAGNLTSEVEVQVMPAEIVYLKVTPEAVTAKAGEKIKLEAVGEDRFGNVAEETVIWSLTDKRLGRVTAESLFVPQQAGSGFIIATAGDIVERIPVEVKKGSLATLKITPAKTRVTSGEKRQFEVTGFDAGGNEIAVTPSWSVQKGLGVIDDQGLLTAKKADAGVVRAASQEIETTAAIEVVPGPPASIKVTPEKITATAGDRVQLAFEAFDAEDNPVPSPDYRWAVEGELGEVTAGNLFLARKAGEGTISLIAGQAAAEISAVVNVGGIHRIDMIPPSAELKAGARVSFQARGYDQQGNEVELSPVWAVAGGIGKIDEAGEFEAQTTGQGQVSCQMGNILGVAPVRVQPGAVKRIAVDPPETSVPAGQSVTFNATAYDAYDNQTAADFNWSLEAEKQLGKFAAPGVFTPEKTGTGKIVASVAEVNGFSKLKVTSADLTRIEITPDSLNLASGQNTRLKAVGRDKFSNPIAISPQWSVEPTTLGHVDPEGVFTAQKEGEGTLKAVVQRIESQIPVKITPGEPTSLRIKAPAADIVAGKNYQFTVMGSDEGGNVFPIKAQWAVTKDLGRIEKETGRFYATKVGNGTIVAYYQDIVADIPLVVKPGILAYIFIEPNPVTVASDSKQAFELKGLDIEKNKVQIEAAEWEVQGGIGQFEKPGTFYATRQGKGKVVARVGKLLAEAYVTIVPGKPDPDNSRIRLTRTQAPADGATPVEIIIEVRDTHNNPVPQMGVKLISDRQGDMIQQPAKTDAKGTTRARVSSADPGTSMLSAVVADQPFRDTARVTFQTQ